MSGPGRRIAYALAAFGATAGAAWFAYRETERYFIFHEVPLPFERFGLVAAFGAACLVSGLAISVYRLVFDYPNRRNSA